MDHRTVGYNGRGPLGVGVALSLAHLHTGSKYCTVTHLIRFDHFQPLIRQCAAYCVCYRTNLFIKFIDLVKRPGIVIDFLYCGSAELADLAPQ